MEAVWAADPLELSHSEVTVRRGGRRRRYGKLCYSEELFFIKIIKILFNFLKIGCYSMMSVVMEE